MEGKANVFSDKLAESDEINILFVTDWHLHKENAEKLKSWYGSRPEQNIQLVIVGGDFDNIPDPHVATEEETAASEERIANFLIHLECFYSPIYYVPGNHDPATLFAPAKEGRPLLQLTQFSHNVHKRAISIASGLSIFGIGGSIPATKIDLKTGSTSNIWNSYPYSDDEAMQTDITQLQHIVDTAAPQEQFIFVSHNGPYSISTTLFSMDEDQRTEAGSKSLLSFLHRNSQKIFLNFHGHVHPGQGHYNLNGTHIVNAGSLRAGEAATLKIGKSKVDGTWKLHEMTFFDLNSY